jgi:hypothetical protein
VFIRRISKTAVTFLKGACHCTAIVPVLLAFAKFILYITGITNLFPVAKERKAGPSGEYGRRFGPCTGAALSFAASSTS